jgi:hypothetical protein
VFGSKLYKEISTANAAKKRASTLCRYSEEHAVAYAATLSHCAHRTILLLVPACLVEHGQKLFTKTWAPLWKLSLADWPVYD